MYAAPLLIAVGAGLGGGSASAVLGQDVNAPGVAQEAKIDFLPAADGASLDDVQRRLHADVEYLASDDLEGRGPYSKGQDLAAEFVAKRFAELRLEPVFGPSYFQPFEERPRLSPAVNTALAVAQPGGEAASLSVGVDCLPLHIGALSVEDVPLAFAGFGISAPEHDYDDYAGLDVSGKAVVVLRHEPHSGDPNYFDGARLSSHAVLSRKATLARERGAAAVIFVTDARSLESRGAARADGLVSTASAAKIAVPGLAIFHVLRDRAAQWFPADGEGSLAAIERRLHETRKPSSIATLGRSVSAKGGLVKTTRAMRNVVARLEGAGSLQNQVVIVGAHVDHVGRGEFGSLAIWTKDIHNGADDNASGTATMLEVARRISELAQAEPKTPRRTLLFIAFAGEEMGLLGSEYFVSRSPVATERFAAMINFDMVGRYRSKLILSGYDTSPAFGRLLKAGESASDLAFEYESGGYGPSDHASFYAAGTPVLHFFTGLHRQYHRPDDDVDTLNYPGMAQIADYASRLIWELTTTESAIVRSRNRRASAAAEARDAAVGSDELPGRVPILGVILDQDAARAKGATGYPIAGAHSSNPSATALLRRGDVIVEFGGEAVGAPDVLPKLIAQRRSGERVRLIVIRNGERLSFHITLR